jgi:putative membrane protein
MTSLRELFLHRRRPEPALDIGLPAERTAMAWQRTGLSLAGVSALLVHAAQHDLLLAVPGILGLLAALVLLLGGERRYSWTVRHIEADQSCMAQGMVVALTVGVVAISVAALLVVLTVPF